MTSLPIELEVTIFLAIVTLVLIIYKVLSNKIQMLSTTIQNKNDVIIELNTKLTLLKEDTEKEEDRVSKFKNTIYDRLNELEDNIDKSIKQQETQRNSDYMKFIDTLNQFDKTMAKFDITLAHFDKTLTTVNNDLRKDIEKLNTELSAVKQSKKVTLKENG